MIDPKSSETTGYHLFFKLEGEVADVLSNCIKRLAQEGGGPVFDPHVTMLGPIAEENQALVIAKATQIAAELQSFHIQLGEIGMLDTFFRALFIKAIPSAELSLARVKALEMFSMHDESPYMPHASLFYGNLSTEIKEQMAAGITLPKNLGFPVDKIYVYRTEGEATEWEQVAVLALQ